MSKQESINLLTQAKNEIQSLRHTNKHMAAQLEMVEVFKAALLGPRPPRGQGLDIAWEIDKQIDMLKGESEQQKNG